MSKSCTNTTRKIKRVTRIQTIIDNPLQIKGCKSKTTPAKGGKISSHPFYNFCSS